MPIEPKYEVLDNLLAKKLFIIPNFQRSYSWRKSQRLDLFDDIETLKNHPESRHHFLASIVAVGLDRLDTIGTTQYQTYEVVDGQQRLTTLIILLKAISKQLDDGDPFEKDEKKSIDTLLVKGDKRIILLQANHDSAIILRNYLENGTIPNDNDVTTIARRNILDAILECEKFVEKWKSTSSVVKLLSMVKNRLGFVFYQLSERGSVYTVFEVLNSRGLDVEYLDKCKSMLMGIAYEKMASDVFASIETELHQIWSAIYRLIGMRQINGDEILMFTSTLFGGEERNRRMSAEDSIEAFREKCLNDPNNTVSISQNLQEVTSKLVLLEEKKEWSTVTKIVHARLLAIALLLRNDIPNIEKLLKQWENVSFRIFGLQRKDSRSKVGEYTKLATNIMAKNAGYVIESEILPQLISLGSDHSIEDSVKYLANSDCYNGWENEVRYFLWKYEKYLSKKTGARISDDAWNKIWNISPSKSVEHIYPQNPTMFYPPLLDFERNVHRLGNLTILTPEQNSQAGRQLFNIKKEIYRNSGLLVNQKIVKDSNGIERISWNIADIDVRETELIDFARGEWKDVV